MSRRGGLVGLVGTGVGMASEYREHRKQQKLSRENSQQDTTQQTAATSSRQPQQSSQAVPSTSDLPPAYEDVVQYPASSSQSIASGGPPMDDKKAALAQYDDDAASSMYDDDDSIDIESDEELWDLDEAGPESPATEKREEDDDDDDTDKPGREEALVNEIMEKHRPALAAATELGFERTPLPVPVIIPQRRPRTKARGFVRAYAPLLGECSGISQETFLLFLNNFQKASKASSIFPVIFISAAIAGLAPSVIAMAVSNAVQVAAGVGMEIQTRQRTNSFLDEMNEQLFRPAGLFAMIVKYKSDKEVAASGNSILARFGVSGEKVDLSTNQVIAKYTREDSSGSMSRHMQNLRLASNTTRGTTAMPEAAPLIFPQIDKAVAQQGEETFKAKAKDAHGFLADYMDKRARLKYATEDPKSMLNLPPEQREFMTKLGDPRHPMYNGGIIGFVSGGHLGGRRGKRYAAYPGDQGGMTRREQKQWHKDDRRLLKYEQRMDRGRDLSRKKERRYDDILAHRGYEQGYDEYSSRGGFGGRRRGRGGPLGLVGKAVGAAVNAASGSRNDNSARSREYEDAYDNRLAPGTQDPRGLRRSFDEREGAYGGPAPYASYGGQQAPAAYGSQQAPAPYGGQQGPAPYGSQGYQTQQGSYSRSGRRSGRGGKGPLGMVKKVMTEDVVYLMIVNMPSEEELAVARETLAKAKAGK